MHGHRQPTHWRRMEATIIHNPALARGRSHIHEEPGGSRVGAKLEAAVVSQSWRHYSFTWSWVPLRRRITSSAKSTNRDLGLHGWATSICTGAPACPAWRHGPGNYASAAMSVSTILHLVWHVEGLPQARCVASPPPTAQQPPFP